MWFVSFYHLFLWGLIHDNSNLLEYDVLEFHYVIMSCIIGCWFPCLKMCVCQITLCLKRPKKKNKLYIWVILIFCCDLKEWGLTCFLLTEILFFFIFYFLRCFFFCLCFVLFCFWLRWVFIAARGLSPVAVSGGCSLLRCTGFLFWWLLLLQSAGFSSYGAWAQ